MFASLDDYAAIANYNMITEENKQETMSQILEKEFVEF